VRETTVPTDRYRIELARAGDALVAFEPTPTEVAAHAPALAAAYNEAHNRKMMAHTAEMSPADVVGHFASLAAVAGRSFLLFRDGTLAGDADFRHVERARAEFAILIAARAAQGRGLGTTFARMLHAFAFGPLALERVYVTVLPANAASLRLFEKLGYRRDESPEARAYVDDPTDLSLSLARTDFERGEGFEHLSIERRS
jgi:RimJ/RimL family protein N-acetyltransferase